MRVFECTTVQRNSGGITGLKKPKTKKKLQKGVIFPTPHLGAVLHLMTGFATVEAITAALFAENAKGEKWTARGGGQKYSEIEERERTKKIETSHK